MDAHTLLNNITDLLETSFGSLNFDNLPPRYTPLHVGAFGADRTDQWTLVVMVNGERFFLTVEKDPDQ